MLYFVLYLRTVMYFVLYLRAIHCTYCTLTILNLINNINEFWIKTKLLVLNLRVYGFRSKIP